MSYHTLYINITLLCTVIVKVRVIDNYITSESIRESYKYSMIYDK